MGAIGSAPEGMQSALGVPAVLVGRELVGNSLAVEAALVSSPVEIARGVEADATLRKESVTTRLIKAMQDRLDPTVGGRLQHEYRYLLSGSASFDSCALEIAGRIKNQRTYGT